MAGGTKDFLSFTKINEVETSNEHTIYFLKNGRTEYEGRGNWNWFIL